MKILLLADYRGVLTGERFYPAGEHDLDEAIASALIAAGRAVLVTSEPEPEPEPVKPTRRRKKAA